MARQAQETQTYTSEDKNGNKWEIGLKDKYDKAKMAGYIKVNGHEFILSNFSTKKSAIEWWSVFSSMLKQGEKNEHRKK